MMTRARAIHRRFVASTRGVVAVEFALIAPLLLLLFLASLDAGRAVAIYMKVRAATYALDAMTNQYTTIHDTDMQTILGAAAVVISPFSSTPASVVISQVSISAPGQTTATVDWSDTLNGTALAVGSSVAIPAGLASGNAPTLCQLPAPPASQSTYNPACKLILGTVNYRYTPMFGYFITGPITLTDSLFMTPRNVTSITRSSP
jgi:Flp pilus assembly protein TadG